MVQWKDPHEFIYSRHPTLLFAMLNTTLHYVQFGHLATAVRADHRVQSASIRLPIISAGRWTNQKRPLVGVFLSANSCVLTWSSILHVILQ